MGIAYFRHIKVGELELIVLQSEIDVLSSRDEALRDEQEKQEKFTRLRQRRSHLSEVLETDKNQYQVRIFFTIQ